MRHSVLPAALVDRIRAYKQILGDADSTSLHRAIDNFKRDANPEREVEIWEHIASFARVHRIRSHLLQSSGDRHIALTDDLAVAGSRA